MALNKSRSARFALLQVCALTIVTTGFITTAHAQSSEETVKFDLPAQSLEQALKSFSVSADKQLMFATDLAEGKTVAGLSGEMGPMQALDELLDGTGLVYETTSSDVILVKVADADQGGASDSGNVMQKPVMMAQSQRPETTIQTTRATPSKTNRDSSNSSLIETIVVTGTRLGSGNRASPSITVDRQDIEISRLSTTQQIIERLPQNFSGGPNLDTSSTVGLFDDKASLNPGRGSSINLRGLGSVSTLTLINGRRVAPASFGAFVDISTIPLSAVERIEVVPDGTSAVYGSDAVAGVVNVILRNEFQGSETQLRAAPDTGSDFEEYQFSQLFGGKLKNTHFLLAYEYYRNTGLLSRDRTFTATEDLTSLGGDDFRSNEGNPGTIIANGTTYAIPINQDGTSLEIADFVAGSVNLFNRREGSAVVPEQERHSVIFNIGYEFSDMISGYVEGRFARRDTVSLAEGVNQRITVPDTNPFFIDPSDTGLNSIRIDYSFIDDLGPQRGEIDVSAFGAVAGLEFPIGTGWTADAFLVSSSDQTDRRTTGILNSAGLATALASSDESTAFNPLGDGLHSSAAAIEQISGFLEDEYTNDLISLNLNIDGILATLPGGNLEVAIGGEYREEAFKRERLDFRFSATPETVPKIDLDRDIVAAYLEVSVPIFGAGNRRRGLEDLALTVAARFEDYSDFGTTTNPKYTLYWSPTEGVAFRGTFGSSFRAPLLSELEVSNEAFLFTPFFPDPISPTGFANSILLFGNNASLQPEEADTWGVGFDIQPTGIPELRLSATYFDIEYANRISSANVVEAIFNEQQFAPLIVRNPDVDTAQALLDSPNLQNFAGTSDPNDVELIVDGRLKNLATTDVSGIDLTMSYGVDTAFGEWLFSIGGSYYLEFDEAVTEFSPTFETLNTVFNPVDMRVRGGLTWTRGFWSASGFVNHIDGYVDDDSDPNRSIDPWTTVDAQLSYEISEEGGGFLDATSLSLSIQNLLDEDPPFVNSQLGIGYDPTNSNPLNRVVSVSLTKLW